jgi:hypothetical protein
MKLTIFLSVLLLSHACASRPVAGIDAVGAAAEAAKQHMLASAELTEIEKQQLASSKVQLEANEVKIFQRHATASAWTWTWSLADGERLTLKGEGDITEFSKASISKD